MGHFLGSFVTIAALLSAEASELAVGDKVAVVAESPITNDGKQMGVLKPGAIVAVREIKGPELFVSGRYAGAIERKNVLPLGEAERYFDQRIKAEPDPLA